MPLNQGSTNNNYLPRFKEFLKKDNYEESELVQKWINEDNLEAIEVSGDTYTLEYTSHDVEMPLYVFNYLDRYMKANEYEYKTSEQEG